ncbi:GNAT family N-acetyltransferase [Nocardia sp. NRRL S-836]|uniref:GNAT family N-acetyltransferase n=1 Tax=Nocardia sp. NRRL S-836 TaxID=1519492 RepID=UPI0007C74929|nr:GNAT family N-acetyltransferase [Nocardia sp. NRRL S-836]
MVTLRRARPDEAGVLTALVRAAKAHWPYDAAFLAAVRDELTVRPGDLERFVIAERDGVVLGCYGIGGTPPAGELTDLWVAPGVIGTGLGRVLWDHAVASAAGYEYLDIDADPYAEGFYLRMGAERIGESPSGSIPGRVLPRLRVWINGTRRATVRSDDEADRHREEDGGAHHVERGRDTGPAQPPGHP